jgi:hypothetical protein
MRARFLMRLVMLTALLVLIPRPALAKGDFEFLISGGGLPQPVTLSSAQIGPIGEFWSPDDPPTVLTGEAYRLDFYSVDGNRRQYGMRWLYYPAAGGALIVDPSPTSDVGEPIRWERFSPAFQDVLNRAINSRSTSAINFAVGVAIAVLLVAVSVPLFGKRTRFAVSYS